MAEYKSQRGKNDQKADEQNIAKKKPVVQFNVRKESQPGMDRNQGPVNTSEYGGCQPN